MAKRKAVKVWKFPPSVPVKPDGTPAKPWEVSKWEDGTYSCNCPAWCNLRRGQTERGCKHLNGVLVMEAVEQRSTSVTLSVTVPLPSKPAAPLKRRIVLED
jgi:hypothetical protein